MQRDYSYPSLRAEGHSHDWTCSDDAFCENCGIRLVGNNQREKLTKACTKEEISWYAFCMRSCLDAYVARDVDDDI